MGLKKNPQEKPKSHQLVPMLIGNSVFSKGLQLNFDICYLISWTEHRLLQRAAFLQQGWLKRSWSKWAFSHAIVVTPKQRWGTRGEQKGEKKFCRYIVYTDA